MLVVVWPKGFPNGMSLLQNSQLFYYSYSYLLQSVVMTHMSAFALCMNGSVSFNNTLHANLHTSRMLTIVGERERSNYRKLPAVVQRTAVYITREAQA